MQQIYNLDFYSSIKNGILKIKNFSLFEKSILIFWLIGPFIFLIERTPADIWLTLISFIFILRVITKKNWSVFFEKWFICAFCLWFIGLISAFLSPMPFFSFGQGFVWIRFPLYALAIQHWLGKDRDIRIIFFSFLTLSFLVMLIILSAELLIDPKSRLTWPYNDLIPGSFLAKSCLSVFCVATFLLFCKDKEKFILSFVILIFGIYILKMTGERSNFVLVFFSCIVSCLFVNLNFKSFIFKIIFICFTGIVLFTFYPNLFERCMQNLDKSISCARKANFLKEIPIFNYDTSYWGSWRGGLQQGLEKPIIGIGPSGTRHSCGLLEDHWLPGKNYCGNHPHNIYIQLFAEVGFLGLILGILTFFFITMKCFMSRDSIYKCPLNLTAFIIPLGIFFPLQHFGSFYGQWGNLFIWFAIGFALSNVNIYKTKKNNY